MKLIHILLIFLSFGSSKSFSPKKPQLKPKSNFESEDVEVPVPENITAQIEEFCEKEEANKNSEFNKEYCAQLYNKDSIVDVIPAEKDQFPFIVELMLDMREKVGICTGSLISQFSVLTSAGCFQTIEFFHGQKTRIKGETRTKVSGYTKISREPILAFAGSSSRACNANKQARAVSSLSLQKDIAIATVEDKFELDEHTSVIRLPYTDFYEPGSVFTIVGWGRIKKRPLEKSRMEDLHYSEQKIIDAEQCVQEISINPDTTFCSAGHTSVFNGNFGGPAIIYEEDKLPTLIGINTLVDVDCGRVIWQSTVKITRYSQWIEENTVFVKNMRIFVPSHF